MLNQVGKACVCVKFQLSNWSRTASENYSGSGRVGWVQSDYKAISVQLQLQLPAGTELGKNVYQYLTEKDKSEAIHFKG